MLIDEQDSTRLDFVVKLDVLMNTFDKIKPKATLDDDRRLDYLNEAIENDPAIYKMQTNLENATSTQATASGSTAAPVTYKQVFEEVKTHAKYLDSNGWKKHASSSKSSKSSGLKVLAASVSGESAHSNGEYSAPEEISSFLELSQHEFKEISESELCRVAEAAWKDRKPRNPNADIPADIYKLISKEFKKEWVKLPQDGRMKILNKQGKNADLITNYSAKVFKLEKDRDAMMQLIQAQQAQISQAQQVMVPYSQHQAPF